MGLQLMNATGFYYGIGENVTTAMEEQSALVDFQGWFARYHGYLSLIVCVFGIISNVLNILVLTRKSMRTPTNCILTGLAVSDMLTMMSYIPFAWHFYCRFGPEPSLQRNSRDWMVFQLFHAHFTITTHTVSIWLGVVLAVFRYLYIKQSMKDKMRDPMKKARVCVVLTFVGSIILVIPNYLLVHTVPKNFVDNSTYYDLVSDHQGHIQALNFWTQALLVKLVPCGLMIVFGSLLLRSIRLTWAKGLQMRREGSNRSQALRNRMREHARTTRMLILVIILFLLTELPQGIVTLICGIDTTLYASTYAPLGDLFDFLALINNSINFILYCSMSKTFRDAFLCVLCYRTATRHSSVSEVSKKGNANYIILNGHGSNRGNACV